MNLKGLYLTILIGASVPVPAPKYLMESLDNLEVTHSDKGRSGFQMTFQAGRSTKNLLDYKLTESSLLDPFNRVVLIVTLNGTPRVLMDGIISRQELAPSNEPGASRLTVTGEDVSLMMDMDEKSEEHPAQSEMIIAMKIIASYAQYGLIPDIKPPFVQDIPLPTERIPVQQGTDLEFLNVIAQRFGYIFFVRPGPVPLSNTAYWGPPARVGSPQRALSINMGPESNVDSINFQNNALAPVEVVGKILDRSSDKLTALQIPSSLRSPLARAAQRKRRSIQFRQSGHTSMQASARARGIMDASADETLSCTGELDAMRYGGLLEARGLVGLRGAGRTFDGLWYVKSVTHKIRQDEYKQSFTLSREGTGASVAAVIP